MSSDPADPSESYLSVRQLARRAGVAEVTIRRYARAGKLRYEQPGGKNGKLLFPPDCLEQSGRHLENTGAPCAPSNAAGKRLSGRKPKWQSGTS